MINKEDQDLKNQIKELELKNVEELLSLERLIILLEDIKNIENSNLNFIKKNLDEIEFNPDLIIGNLGNVLKSYFDTYYEIKKKQNKNLEQLIISMRTKAFSKSNNKNEEFVIVFNNINSPDNKDNNIYKNYIYKNDIFEIFDSLSLLNQYYNEYNENFETNINKKLNHLKEMENFKELDILKAEKGDKIIFESKINNICKDGTECDEYNEVKNILIKDNSDEQNKAIWMINYFNNSRSKLSSVELNIFTAFKELFEILIDKLYEKKLFQGLDLIIILTQTFSTKKDNNNYLLVSEFREKEIFHKEDFWKNMISQKIEDLIANINIARKDDIGSEAYINYAKENIEPIILSYIFTMKDFRVSGEMKKKIIEDVCKSDKYKQYKFESKKLLDLS